ncbi:uncharacterized protein LOC133185916 [Saccostrea echinata]|uniref:uncharacterized protein LOC133185916 n=1 Tax=Saccostrea echinata TaxID=191078 RepID=UPI002A7F233F|nr:uncharacterized protein LOC133185916 [Saccostrea echinata]
MATVVNVALRVLSWIVTFMFLMASLVKVCPFIGQHAEMAKEFVKLAEVCPTAWFGYVPPSYVYMVTVGAWELFCVIGLFTTGLRKTCYGILSVIMIGAMYSHIALNDYKGLPPSVFLLVACSILFLSTSSQPEKLKAN